MTIPSSSRLGGRIPPPEWLGLGALFLFTAAAVLGYGVFALHPHLIPDSEGVRAFYGQSFKLFARAHILAGALVLVLPLVLRVGLRWLPAFGAVAGVSFLSEYLGTGYGFPFGSYEYTGLLGYKLGGRVPFLIPVSWFLMALPSWVLAAAFFPSRPSGGGAAEGGFWGRVLLGGYFLTVWDLALDPAMSFLTPYWTWEATGPYFGMPWVNLAGWMGTAIVLMVLLEYLGVRRWALHLSFPWYATYYGLVLLMPLGMVAAAGLWTAVLATAGALLLPWAVRSFAGTRMGRGQLPDLAGGEGAVP
jgi:putative membrane protein